MQETPDTRQVQPLQYLADVPIQVQAELDQRQMAFGELLDLDVGSLVRLSRPTGENIDVYAAGVLLGWGEVLLIDGNMAVRIADVKDAPGVGE